MTMKLATKLTVVIAVLTATMLAGCGKERMRKPEPPPASTASTQSSSASEVLAELTEEPARGVLLQLARDLGREMAKEMKKELGSVVLPVPGEPNPTSPPVVAATNTAPTTTAPSTPPPTGGSPVKLASVEEVKAFYDADKEFFAMGSISELPEGLQWQDGSEVPVFASPNAKRGGTYHDYTPDFPRTLRFVGPDANGAFRRYILDHNALTLVMPNPNGDGYYPGLATHWAFGKDGKTVYFKLDPDARYSDGKPVRVTDFWFHFYFMRSKHIKAPWYNDYFDTEKFLSCKIYDSQTLSVTYYKAKPDVISKVGGLRPVPEHYYEELDENFIQDYQFEFEPTTGAYEVRPENVKKGESITLTRVPSWWADKKKYYRNRFNPDAIKVTVIRDLTKAFELFKKGEIDLHGLSLAEFWYDKLPDSAPEVKNGYIHKITFYNNIPRPSWAVRINSAKPLLNNPDIRHGLHHAMNFELVIRQFFRGDYERMRSVCDGYGPRSHPTLRAREFSVEKAQQAFAKAGFNRRGADGILVNSQGKRLSFTFTTAYKRLEEVMTILKEEAKKAGVELNLEIMEMTAAWKKVDEKNHELALAALNTSVELYPRFWEPYHSDNAYKEPKEQRYDADGNLRSGLTPKPTTNNSTMCADREIDELIERFRKSEDLDEITKLSHQLAQKLHDHGGYIPGWVRPWYRVGYWRWIQWPKTYNVMKSREPAEYHVHWIDVDAKAKTLAAMEEGNAFQALIKVYDQFKAK